MKVSPPPRIFTLWWIRIRCMQKNDPQWGKIQSCPIENAELL
jgi:hypothetical protein